MRTLLESNVSVICSETKSYWRLLGIALVFIFLYLTSGLFLIAVTVSFVAIFLGLQEVERRRHSLWNLSTPWRWCTKQIRWTLLPSDTLQLSYLLSGVPNRSVRLFNPLTFLRFNSKRSAEQVRKDYSTFRTFYGLARHAKHQTS